jgi:hypothetical protein
VNAFHYTFDQLGVVLMKVSKKIINVAALLVFSSTSYAQCLTGVYESSGSLTESQFNSGPGRDPNVSINLSVVSNKLNYCSGVRGICQDIGDARDGLRIAFDSQNGVAYYAFEDSNNKLMAGWVDSKGSFKAPSQVMDIRTDETPVIAYNSERDTVVISYERDTAGIGGGEADMLSVMSRNPQLGVWINNSELENGAQTRFGPDHMCAGPSSNEFILQFRGRTQSNKCFQSIYDVDANRWGNQTSCDDLF